MKKIFATLISSSILAASVTLLSAPANAASFKSCNVNGSYNIANNVTGTSNCTISKYDSQDKINEGTVNQRGGFFGNTDWEFGGKIGEDAGYVGTKKGQDGTWDISRVIQDTWKDVMLVFKSGNGTKLVGYEVADGVTSGDWDSPFEASAFENAFKNTKDVSHISVYYTKGTSTPPRKEIPEPANLFGIGVVGGAIVLSRHHR